MDKIKNYSYLTLYLILFVIITSNGQSKVDKVGDKIYGDFNGDGKSEYAYRLQTKKGYGNPVEDGVSDEYQIRFSDVSIKPIIRNFNWFILINEGDLNNDGTDEISVRQDPINGCIGYVSTYTIKKNTPYILINDFTFYSGSCDDIISISPQDLIEKNNGYVYYYEYDANGKYSINKSGKKILAKKIKAFPLKPESKPIAIEQSKTSKYTSDALSSISNSSKSNTKITNEELTKRRIVEKPLPEYNCNEQGTVVLQIIVNPQGNVIYSKLSKGTTNITPCLVDACQEAALKIKYEPDENAPDKQFLFITYNFKLGN